MRSLVPGRAGNRHEFRTAVRAAEAAFLQTFVGPDNNANRPFFMSIEHARLMLTAQEAAQLAGVSDLQINRIEGAIACLLCHGLRIELAHLSGLHEGFAERRDKFASIGAPDLSLGLAAVQAFALEERSQVRPLTDLASKAAALYWQASWCPNVPWVYPDGKPDQVQPVSIRGTNQPDDTLFFSLPPDEFIAPLDPRPGEDAEPLVWRTWWYYQLRHFPSQAWIWQGHRLWVPLRVYMCDLYRLLEDDS